MSGWGKYAHQFSLRTNSKWTAKVGGFFFDNKNEPFVLHFKLNFQVFQLKVSVGMKK